MHPFGGGPAPADCAALRPDGSVQEDRRLPPGRPACIVRPGQHNVIGNSEGDFVETLEATKADFADHGFSSFTTISSLPRSSITFTATLPCRPSVNGALTLPDRCAHTLSSNSA